MTSRSWASIGGSALAIGLVLLVTAGSAVATGAPPNAGAHPVVTAAASRGSHAASPVGNFSAAIDRLVELVGIAGAGLLALVWARVALSWFSHDTMKKVQAKERARDALVGTLLFVAAVSGLVWALAQWVFTGA